MILVQDRFSNKKDFSASVGKVLFLYLCYVADAENVIDGDVVKF